MIVVMPRTSVSQCYDSGNGAPQFPFLDNRLPVRRRLLFFVFPCALFLLNAYLCRELFTVEYTRHMGSIEAAYISISRLMMNHWSDLSWFPEWYSGIPQQNSYPPLLHFLVALFAWAVHISPALSHHAVTAFFYSLGPVTLYLLAARLSGSRPLAFLAGLVYSLEAPSALLSREVRIDLGGAFLNRRLDVLVPYGEGPHITSVALLPLALLALDRALDSRRPWDVLLAALALVAVVLTNWLGAFALAAAVLCLLLSRIDRIDAALGRSILWATGIGVLAYLLASPWIPPSTIRTVQTNARAIGGDYTGLYRALPLYAGAALIAVVAIQFGLRRLQAPRAVQFFFLFSLPMSAVALAAYWAGASLLPQPKRYHVEMDLALCGLFVFGGWWLLSKLPARWAGWARVIAAAALVCALFPQVHRYRKYARSLVTPIDIRQTTEYKTTMWMDAHANGARVLVPAATSFWFNAFTDTPQLGGGFDQGRPFLVYPIASYFLYSGDGGDTGEATRLWLQACGVRFVAVGGPKSGEFYKPFQRLFRFEGQFPVLWRDGDDAIYSVPQRSPSLAHVVEEGEGVRDAPQGAYDLNEVRRFVEALQNPARPEAALRWTSRHSARITAQLTAGQRIEVQETWHAGWRASVQGQSRPVKRDGLEFMVIDPKCSGQCTIDLVYDGGLEMLLARLASAVSLFACLVWIGLDWRKRSQAAQPGRA